MKTDFLISGFEIDKEKWPLISVFGYFLGLRKFWPNQLNLNKESSKDHIHQLVKQNSFFIRQKRTWSIGIEPLQSEHISKPLTFKPNQMVHFEFDVFLYFKDVFIHVLFSELIWFDFWVFDLDNGFFQFCSFFNEEEPPKFDHQGKYNFDWILIAFSPFFENKKKVILDFKPPFFLFF